MLVEFYGPFFLILIFNVFFYYRIYKKIWHNNSQTYELKEMKKLLDRLKFYPLALIMCFGVANVHRIYYFINGSGENFYFDLFSGCLVALYGFINAIVYGFTRSVRNAIRRTITNLFSPGKNAKALNESLVKD